MIVRQNNKYVIKSKEGTKILGSYATKEEALKRLAQIEYFKKLKGNK